MTDRFLLDPERVSVGAEGPLPDACGARDRPLHVEIGFGKDVRILRMAAADPKALFLGVEISRKKHASFCRKVARLGLANIRAFHGDARHVLLDLLPERSVASFTILFPDPWPKRKHWKNRWITPETAALLARAIRPPGPLIVATDHEGYRTQIRDSLQGAGFVLESERNQVPEDDRTIFTTRFERLGSPVSYLRWHLPSRRCAGSAANLTHSS